MGLCGVLSPKESLLHIFADHLEILLALDRLSLAIRYQETVDFLRGLLSRHRRRYPAQGAVPFHFGRRRRRRRRRLAVVVERGSRGRVEELLHVRHKDPNFEFFQRGGDVEEHARPRLAADVHRRDDAQLRPSCVQPLGYRFDLHWQRERALEGVADKLLAGVVLEALHKQVRLANAKLLRLDFAVGHLELKILRGPEAVVEQSLPIRQAQLQHRV
mmetsp:Transcript_25413/g.83581  ORF Transcript_25413/g.83581 Transcript_25413/m.83581 type:complete len:216 (+) Transcript_25413:424-1071(+)